MDQFTITPLSSRKNRKLLLAMNIVLALTGLAALGTLVIEYGGFLLDETQIALLHMAQAGVVGVFVLDRLARLLLAIDRWQYLRENWLDFLLMLLLVSGLLVTLRMGASALGAAAAYVLVTQVYLLIVLILRAMSVNMLFAQSGLHPSWLLIGSFAMLCLVGSGLLMLPKATADGVNISYLNSLFTSISAVCVTGLTVLDTGRDFTPFGQTVILILIQLGGLGIMLYGTVLAMLIGKGLTVRGSSALGEMMSTEHVGQISRLVKFVIISTFGVELLGAVLLYPMFASTPGSSFSPIEAAWYSIFHSVSAFCNAGFSLYSSNLMAGVNDPAWSSALRTHWQVLGVMAPLIVLGGLGFPVLEDCIRVIRCRIRNLLGRRMASAREPVSESMLTLHSKIVLTTTFVLLVLGASGFLIMQPVRSVADPAKGSYGAKIGGEARRTEYDWVALGPAGRIREAAFQSVTARTAGFNTVDFGHVSNGGKLWTCMLMVIGGGPASTAGGMKVTVFAILILIIHSVLRRRTEIEVYGRSLPVDLLRKAVTVAALFIGMVLAVTLALCLAQDPGESFINMLFEACSACGTVGLSTGLTPKLADPGKIAIMVGMFIGRIGPMTLLLALTTRVHYVKYSYPNENVVIG